MDETYTFQPKAQKRWGVIVLGVVLALVLLGGGYLWLTGSNKKVISPVPPQPDFEVIFYTPTPAPVTPTSTPSATPKVKATAAPTKAPTATPKVTSAATPSATTKPTATLTPKP